MPATPKTHSRPNPYDRPKSEQAASASEESSQQPEQPSEQQPEQVVTAEQLAQAVRKANPKKTFLDFRTLTKEVLKACLELQDPKPTDAAFIGFHRFNLRKYCEMTGLDFDSFDLRKFGSGNMTIKVPFCRLTNGIKLWEDEKTQKIKYTISFSLYNPENQQELDDLNAWIEGPYKDVVLDLINEKYGLFGETPDPDSVFQRRMLEKMWSGPIRLPGEEYKDYKNTLIVKAKTNNTDDSPIIQVWNEKTKGVVSYNQVQAGDQGSCYAFFEGVTKVQGKFYARCFTRALIYTDPIVYGDAGVPTDESYPE